VLLAIATMTKIATADTRPRRHPPDGSDQKHAQDVTTPSETAGATDLSG
jgi:hypothetical protein